MLLTRTTSVYGTTEQNTAAHRNYQMGSSLRPVAKTSGNSSDCPLHQTATGGHEQLGGNKRMDLLNDLRMRMRIGRRAWLWTNLADQM